MTDLKATTSPLLGEISNVILVKNSVVSLEIRTGFHIHTVYFKILTLVITDAFNPNPEGPTTAPTTGFYLAAELIANLIEHLSYLNTVISLHVYVFGETE